MHQEVGGIGGGWDRWRVSSGVGYVGWRVEELFLDTLFGVGGKATQLCRL